MSQLNFITNRTKTLGPALRVLVPSGWSNDQKGEFLEDLAAQILRRQSYEVKQRLKFTGMEIDLLARHGPSGDDVYVECKFLDRPFSANVPDLMFAQAFRRSIKRMALFSASRPGKDAAGVIEDLKALNEISFSFYGPEEILAALIDSGTAPSLPQSTPPSVSHATLVLHPEQEKLWLLQDEQDGRPIRAMVAGSSHTQDDLPALRALLDTHEVLIGLPLELFSGSTGMKREWQEDQRTKVEIVSTVTTAEDLIDYRPCRPEDFVGRTALQKEVWDFLSAVRDGRSETRLLALVGASGYGKSSLVAKLAQRFRNKKWRSKYFLFPVDVRSARGPMFVGEAILAGIRAAGEAGFLDVPADLRISDADNVLSSLSIRSVLEQVRRDRKVLVLFFDQFEEAFTKDELFPVFQAFRRTALDISAARENLVLGFSWRTGISLSNDNPAYQLWNELRDHRLTKSLGAFEAGEASRLITQFEQALGTKLLPPLRRRLHEQGQGLPWFLKKLCIHVYQQVERGASQIDLLGSQLNVEKLFAEDLEPLSEAQLACVRYIAANSPADALEVYERFGDTVVNDLVEKRLVIRAGPRLAVYWDIFRDYLTDGKVPFIPLTYIPNATFRMAMSACRVLGERGTTSTDGLAAVLGYTNPTIVNIVTDLQNFAVAGKNDRGEHHLLPGLRIDDICDRLRSQLAGHVLYQALLKASKSGGALRRSEGIEIVRELYAASQVKPRTRDNYLAKLIPWLEFAGLIEASRAQLVAHSGDSFGARYNEIPNRKQSARETTFLAASPPEASLDLLRRLFAEDTISKERVLVEFGRNAAADLVALDLAVWGLSRLELVAEITENRASAEEAFELALAEDPTMRKFDGLVEGNPGSTRSDIGAMLGSALQRTWKETSALRYANGLSRYRDYLRESRDSK